MRHSSKLAVLASVFAGLNASMQVGAQSALDLGISLRSAKRPQPRFRPYTDPAGMPHGRSGDKFRRKAMSGTIGIRSGTRGPLASMLIVRKAKFPFSSTKR